jgi:XTP/dITP diphosphohydrolase
MTQILLASSNPGKIKEIKALLSDLPIEIIPQSEKNIPDADETGLTFVENALLKARQGAQYSGLPCIADDSGLCVEALQGAPGIYSARYAGIGVTAEQHIQKLLKALESIPHDKRQAHYYCTIVFMQHAEDPAPFIYQGKWDGMILTHPQGTQGFGYDPIFFIPNLNCSAAEISLEQKNTLSHRAQALQALKKQLTLLSL